MLDRDEIRNLAKDLGTFFVDQKIQEIASKSDFINLIDDGVDKNDLIKKLNQVLKNKNIIIDTNNPAKELIKVLDKILEK